MTLTWAYSQTGRASYLDKAHTLLSNLLSPESRPYGKGFVCFEWHYGGRGNGLIGQVWAMEALIAASKVLQTPVYSELVQQLWLEHPFDESLGLWRTLEPDGTVGRVHLTLNQQVWFAAIGQLLPPPRAEGVDARVHRFLECIEGHMEVAHSGLLGMQIIPDRRDFYWRWQRLAPALRKWARQALRRSSQFPEFTYRERSVGYHAFTLYGFALLRQQLPDHPVWHSPKLKSAVRWASSDSYRRALRCNPFAMGYNPAGYETPFIMGVFLPLTESKLIEASRWWLTEQVRRHYNPETRRFDRNTPDPATLTARAYEATRLPNALLDLPLH